MSISPGQAMRHTDTPERIKTAFAALLAEKGFEGISVRELCLHAGISRGTFYLHYTDKYDLLERLEDEVILHLHRILFLGSAAAESYDQNELFPADVILEALRYVTSDLAFISAIAGPGGDPNFRKKLTDALEILMNLGLKRAGRHLDGRGIFPESYVRTLLLGGVVGIILRWLAHNAAETPEEVAGMISAYAHVRPSDFVV